MIKQFTVSHFRSLKNVSLSLEPLTVLVGPNGSGKSALLAALNPRMGLVATDLWQHSPGTIERRFDIDGEVSTIQQQPGWGVSMTPSLERTQHQLLRLDLNSLRQANQLEAAGQLAPDGGNLSNVFSTLTRQRQAALAKQACGLIPLFTDVGVVPTNRGYQQLRFQDRWNPDVWYYPHEVSDGTMLLVAFLTLQFQTPHPSLLAIEEPERALHPYLLEQLIGMLRRLSRGELGAAPMQVVLATHSAELLDYVEPQEVRFLGRDPADGSVTVRAVPATDADWPRYFHEYRESLKDAWLSGGLGGVPGS